MPVAQERDEATCKPMTLCVFVFLLTTCLHPGWFCYLELQRDRSAGWMSWCRWENTSEVNKPNQTKPNKQTTRQGRNKHRLYGFNGDEQKERHDSTHVNRVLIGMIERLYRRFLHVLTDSFKNPDVIQTGR